MPSAVAKRKGLSSVSSIEDAFSAYLNELRAELPAVAVKNTKTVIEMLKHYLNTCDEAGDNDKFCSQCRPAELVDHLDRFIRYCAMRELVLTFEQQEVVFFVTYDFCEWLYKNKLLADGDFVKSQLLKDQHMDMWERACSAAYEIASLQGGRKAMNAGNQVIDFGRHDIARIEGDQIWLEIWSLPTLPKNRDVGPITLPKKLAASLQVGWMLTCKLAKSKSEWHIVDIGNIYPSLPFN